MSSPKTIETDAHVKNGVARMIIAIASMVINVLFVILIVFKMRDAWAWFTTAATIMGLGVVLYIYGRKQTASIKMPWMLLILLVPIGGLVFYLLVGHNRSTKKMRQRYRAIDSVLLPLLPDNRTQQEELEAKLPYAANIARYLKNYSEYPVYRNTDITYYSDAAEGLAAQKEELKKAKDFIFMEYHAIQDAESWHGIQDILEEKVKEGVEVRVFYDDMGSIGFVTTDFVKRLEAKGINARVFNPFAPD